MNHLISQIRNFEQCNAGVPESLLLRAAADVVRDMWQDDKELTELIDSGVFDFKDSSKEVNAVLADAGSEYETTPAMMEEALKSWVEFNRE